jgi:hypothetical protein
MSWVAFEAHWPLALLALIPLLWWVRMRSRTNLGPRHLTTLTFLRTCAVTLVVLALMRPVWTAGSSAVSVVYALDVSRSVATAFIQSALEFTRRATKEGGPASARYVVFADSPRLAASVEAVSKLAVTQRSDFAEGAAIRQGATDIERALDEALLGFAPDEVKRLVLFTDGNQNHGDVASSAAAEGAGCAGVRFPGHAARHPRCVGGIYRCARRDPPRRARSGPCPRSEHRRSARACASRRG